MGRSFDAFVMFAEMRTGSNALEASLNTLDDVTCYGEVYNPTFVGHHNQDALFGFDMTRREADPIGLLDALIAKTDGLPGFRLFHDHDDRVLERVLPDPRIAKIILTRKPLDSYVSRKIASATGQWRLTDMKAAKTAQIRFDAAEFREMLEAQTAFQARLRRGLQATGQTAFHLSYEDINDPDVLGGLARFLGSSDRIERPSAKLKKQNPADLKTKVANYDEMIAALSGFDRFGLDDAPTFEAERAPGVPGFVAHPEVGLLYMPIAGGDDAALLDWMAHIGGVGRAGLFTGMNQKALRQWMRAHPGFRSFTVLRHPVDRAHQVFCRYFLRDDDSRFADIRRILKDRYKVGLPEGGPDGAWDITAHRAGFVQFLAFLKGNLAGQTSLRVDAAWASQVAVLQGFSRMIPPQHQVRAASVAQMLPLLAREAGESDPPEVAGAALEGPFSLSEVYAPEIEAAAKDTYRRDYVHLGFGPWQGADG